MRLIILSFVLFGMTCVSVGQNYYRSRISGRWDDASTWESSTDSINWSDAIAFPDFNSNTIVVSAADTVFVMKTVAVDETIIEQDAVLIVNGPGSDPDISLNIINGPD